jgi:rhodanese-related sulfurtransferase
VRGQAPETGDPSQSCRGATLGRVLSEAFAIGAAGLLLALLANAASPRGLSLTRNYFPASPASPAGTNAALATGNAGTNRTVIEAVSDPLAARLREKGLQLVDSNVVSRLHADPRCAQDLIVFIDARDDEHYQSGHIPGAYLFDYYHPADTLPTVLQACQLAEQIVVYCNGGNCEDSEFAATFLLSANVPKEKLLVYGGGFAEWATNRLPIEIGQRRSGNLK